MAKDSELFRKERIPALKSMIASGLEAIKVLDQQKPVAVDEVRREIERFKVELAELEVEEKKFNFPPLKNELEAFPPMEREWWELKKDFFRKFFKLPVKSEEFRRLRWRLVEEYRKKLSKLMHSNQVKPVHYQEYQRRKPQAFKAYIQKHSEYQNWWNQLGRVFAIQTPGFSLEQSSGMAIIVGSIVECSVPPPQCRGEQISTSRPLSGIEMTLTRTEGELTLQGMPSGGQRLLPPTYRTISDQQGRFAFPSLSPGDYSLSGELSLVEKNERYRSLVRNVFLDGEHEVLIVDLPAERLDTDNV